MKGSNGKRPKNKRDGSQFSESERLRVFLGMITVGGYLGSFVYVLRGGVFSNAQTGNILLFSIRLGQGEGLGAFYYLIPVAAYLVGIVISELFSVRLSSKGRLSWPTVFVAVEAAAVFVLGAVPVEAPVQICQIAVSFLAAMQYNTFKKAENEPMATTFCTNHLRQTGGAFARWILNRDREEGRRTLSHVAMIAAFVFGAAVSAALAKKFGVRSLWFAEIPLFVILADLIRADSARARTAM